MDASTVALIANFGVPTLILAGMAFSARRISVFLSPLIQRLIESMIAYLNSQKTQAEQQTVLMERHQESLESQGRKLDDLLLMSRSLVQQKGEAGE